MRQVVELTLPPVAQDTAAEPVKSMLENVEKQYGFIPNMYATMANLPGLLDTYLTGYKWFREHSGFTPAEQEVVFLTISLENTCDYCVSAHSMIADKVSKVPSSVLEAIRASKSIPDAQLAALSVFTRTMFDKRGSPSSEDVRGFTAVVYTGKHILEIILALAAKTLSNYSNHVLDTKLDARFADYAWSQS